MSDADAFEETLIGIGFMLWIGIVATGFSNPYDWLRPLLYGGLLSTVVMLIAANRTVLSETETDGEDIPKPLMGVFGVLVIGAILAPVVALVPMVPTDLTLRTGAALGGSGFALIAIYAVEEAVMGRVQTQATTNVPDDPMEVLEDDEE